MSDEEYEYEYHGQSETLKSLGLTYVGDVDAGAAYESDVFHVEYKADTSTFYWAEDGGCSCWSGITISSLDDFSGSGTAQQAHDALNEWTGTGDDEWSRSRRVAGDVADLHLKIAEVR